MTARHGKGLFLVSAFLLIIFGVGLTQAVIELHERERPVFLNLFLARPTVANLRRFESDLENALYISQQLQPWMRYLQFRILGDPGPKALIGRNNWLFYKPGVEYLIEPWPPRAGNSESGDDPITAIVSFRDQLEKRGITLLVVPAPGKASVEPQMLTSRARQRDKRVSIHTRKIMTQLELEGVEVFNLFDLFCATTGQAHSTYYLAQDTHWSPRGMRLAAEAVARRLLDLGWVKKGTLEYQLRPIKFWRLGDVIRMMRIPWIEEYYSPEELDCEQVIRADTEERYKDDPNSEVLILGDSFLRIYELDEPGSSGFVAHLARYLKFPLASIISDGGASTLVRQELSRKPALLAHKKVVIWEFVERDIRFGMEGWQDVPLPVDRRMSPGE